MISYPFIEDLFKGILQHSNAIKGRFHVSYKYGAQEINSDLLGEVLKDVQAVRKYPLAMMIAPRSRGQYKSKALNMWDRYRITMFFVKPSFYDSNNQVSFPNPNTGTSLHSVQMDWQDMRRCAINFLKQLDNLQSGGGRVFRIAREDDTLIHPLSIVGADRVSGVRLDFDLELWMECVLEDYDEFINWDLLNISMDSHPEHAL